ncbi:MAG: undecaprenyl/decaprenyl-phosphate alpha-N-acetylglucosaminyl 1-phosphate transferase [Chloroflexi bacterium]|nr:undecaprenyl/decaprenyl-phosphate alpha-N-acetylglucosaminyl 1-phosphate transferase [Chloroflexota bacterium]
MTPASTEILILVLGGLAAAAATSFVLTPVAASLARRADAIDRPDPRRRVHSLPTPRGGGLAVALAFGLVSVIALLAAGAIGILPARTSIDPLQFAALLVGVVVAAGLGFVDDRWEVPARWQLLAQGGLALLVVGAGITIDFINNPFGRGFIRFDEVFAVVFTIVWVVGMINSINFIDGLDGLSTGVALIAALTLGIISLSTSQYQPWVAVLCAILVGSLAGFLPWNFHPAHVFIGTAGVYVIGFALAVLSILGTAKVAVALLVLGVPIIDTFWIIVRRLREGQSPFTPDRGHFHHRLLDLGLSHREAVLLIYVLCAALAVLSLFLSGSGQLYAFMGIVVAGGVVLALVTRRAREAREALEASTYESPDGPAGDVVKRANGGRLERRGRAQQPD